MNDHLDSRDQALFVKFVAAREKLDGPRIGDYLRFPTGELERFSHDLGDALQTSPGGSIFLNSAGGCSFSGGLNPSTPLSAMSQLLANLPGTFWFFHHGLAEAGRAVYFNIDCRVYQTTASYKGYLGADFQSASAIQLKIMLGRQLNPEAVTGVFAPISTRPSGLC